MSMGWRAVSAMGVRAQPLNRQRPSDFARSLGQYPAGRRFVGARLLKHSVFFLGWIVCQSLVWGQTVYLNEFLASATGPNGLVDEDGQAQGWIEIFNGASSPVDLNGWSLTDDPQKPGQWKFPAISLARGQYLTVFASGKDRTSGNLHTNFKLGLAGKYLGLFHLANGTNAVSELTPGFPEQRSNYSYGRDATGNWAYYQTPTPGAANGTSTVSEAVLPVRFSIGSGLFSGAFHLALSTPTTDGSIRYTTDGSEPTDSHGILYTARIPLDHTTIIRAAAFKANALPTATEAHVYLFNATAPIQSLPIMSMTISPDDLLGRWGVQGIQGGEYVPIDTCFSSWRRTSPSDYFNPAERDLAWERRITLELLPSAGGPGFVADCGLRIRGSDTSRLTYHPDTKFPYTVFFRKDYGPAKLHYPLMPNSQVETFNTLALRAAHNDPVECGGVFVRDELMRRLFGDMGQVSARGTLVNLFINGEYKGYYNPTERIDAHWAHDWYPASGSEWDVIKQYSQAQDGDTAEWLAMLSYAGTHPLSDPSNYQGMAGRLDLTNFVDYLLVNIYGDTRDWTQNNWYAARERVAGGKFRFYVYDAEQSLGLISGPEHNLLTDKNELANTSTNPDLTQIPRLYRALKTSPEFRLLFADRFQKHFSNYGALTENNILTRFNELRMLMSAVIPNMDPQIATVWVPKRRGYLFQQLADAGLLSPIEAPAFNQPGGTVAVGFNLTMSAPAGDIYYTLDGGDPRVIFTSAISATARKYVSGTALAIASNATVKARVLSGTSWSALTEAQFQTAPGIQIVRRPNSALIQFNAVGGNSYTLQACETMESGAWTNVTSFSPTTTGSIEFTESVLSATRRFYRLVSP
jgi:hypothetical protein